MHFFPKDTKFALNSICKWLLKASATDKETCYIYTKYKVKFYLLCWVLPLIFINSDFYRGCFVCFSFASGDQCWESLSHGWFPLLSGPTPCVKRSPGRDYKAFQGRLGLLTESCEVALHCRIFCRCAVLQPSALLAGGRVLCCHKLTFLQFLTALCSQFCATSLLQ